MRPGVGAVIVHPELSLALTVSYGTLSVGAGAAAVGVETSRTQHRHRADLSQAVETPAISTIERNFPRLLLGKPSFYQHYYLVILRADWDSFFRAF